MIYPCSVCLKQVRSTAIYCNVCKTWINRKCANLSAVEFEYLSLSEDEWFCMKCISNIFPFNDISEDELNYLSYLVLKIMLLICMTIAQV